MSIEQPVDHINVDQSVGENPVVEDKNKSLTHKIQESTNNEVRCQEKIERNNPVPTIGDGDKVSKKSLTVSSSEQTRSNALSSMSTTVNNAEQDQNNLDEGTTSVTSKKGIDKVTVNNAEKDQTDQNNLDEGTTSVT